MRSPYDNWPGRAEDDDIIPTPTPPQPPSPAPQKQVPWTAIAVIAAAAFFFYNQQPKPGPGPDAPTPAPAAVLADLAATIDGAEIPTLEATAALYTAMANTIDRVDIGTATTAQLQMWLTTTNTLRFIGTDYVGKLPGFSEVVNTALVSEIGLEDRPATAQDLRAIAEVCRSVAATATAEIAKQEASD